MKNPALWIGCFIAGALLLLVAGILWLSNGHLFQHDVVTVINFQDGVAGLYKGAPVTFRGVPVGEVTDIDLEVDPATGAVRIPVHVLLSENRVTFRTARGTVSSFSDLRSAVRDGLRAKLVLQSIVTGQKAIDLNILPNAAPVVPAPGTPTEIPVVAANFAALEDQVADLPLRQIAQELLATLQSVRTTLTSANLALRAAGTTMEGAGRVLGGVGQDARGTLGAAERALAAVQDRTTEALTALTQLAGNANSTVTAIRPDLVATVRSAQAAAATAQVAVEQVAGLTAPEGPLGSDLQGAVTDLAAAARGLRDWSELLDEQPNALVFGRQSASRATGGKPAP